VAQHARNTPRRGQSACCNCFACVVRCRFPLYDWYPNKGRSLRSLASLLRALHLNDQFSNTAHCSQTLQNGDQYTVPRLAATVPELSALASITANEAYGSESVRPFSPSDLSLSRTLHWKDGWKPWMLRNAPRSSVHESRLPTTAVPLAPRAPQELEGRSAVAVQTALVLQAGCVFPLSVLGVQRSEVLRGGRHP
jgi:hypothetical protein